MFWCSSQHKQGILNSGLIKNPIMPYKKTWQSHCQIPHPKQIWKCKLDVKSQGYGACCVCKLAIFSHILPIIPMSPGGGCSGNKTGALDLHLYARRNSICSGVTWLISGFTRWQLFSSGMFSEVLPGGIIRCSGVT